jgi:hypothetical protein
MQVVRATAQSLGGEVHAGGGMDGEAGARFVVTIPMPVPTRMGHALHEGPAAPFDGARMDGAGA